LFTDDIIKIEPLEGDVWPNSSTEVCVSFRPDQSRDYSRTAFCDVVGRESRLPLQIRGKGLGPQVAFSFDQVDVGHVYVFSSHAFEIVMANSGAVDAIFTLIPPTSTLGRCFRFDPSEGIVMPDAHQAIRVTFSSRIVGDFEEDFFFQIDGSPEQAKITFRYD
jgi:hydrocephalus-inducing protein